MRSRVDVIVNAAAGSANNNEILESIRTAFADSGVDVELFVARTGDELRRFAEASARGMADTVVAAGGDGTVSTVASQLVGTKKVLGVLPLGTLNNFSKDLKIPQTTPEAVRIITDGSLAEMDIGEVNGQYFVNNSSIGLYPRIVHKREQQQRLGYGKWWAAAWATWRFFVLSPFLKARLELGDNVLWRKTPFIFVGNNDYEMDFYNIGRRLRLDNGNLSIYLSKRNGRMGLFLLVVNTLLGRLEQDKAFEEFKSADLTIETRRRRLLVALDGEIMVMDSPLRYKIRHRRLKVLVPKAS